MLKREELDRINELARKKKAEGLSSEEAAEQKVLRDKFLADFRARFKARLESIEIVDTDDPRLLAQKERLKNN